MANEHGEWIMYGVDEDDPYCIKSVEELTAYIEKIGFLPLFRNEIPGFSVEERTVAKYWWTGDKRDPWAWRERIAREGTVAYGKFFDKKAGFISKEWMPYFANYRRDGYDFDARYDDELASIRSKKIMDLFDAEAQWYSYEIKKNAGFGKDGEKNFDGVMTELMMQTYLVMRDFRQKRNKKGVAYGWPVAIYAMPEQLWGYDHIASAYREDPAVSKERIFEHMRKNYPIATEKQIQKVLR